MAGGKLTPRQKMINMMYLVLTAMLALNVSAEVLNAFVIIDKGLTHSIATVRNKNDADISDFEKAMAENHDKVAKWKAKADSVHARTSELYQRIQDLKLEIVRSGDGAKTEAIDEDNNINVDLIEAQDNTDAAPRIMLGAMNSGEAYKLRKEIDDYKQFLLSYVDAKSNTARSIEELLLLEDPPLSADGTFRSWEVAQFESVPLISAIALLSKRQLDIVNCENEALTYLRNQINAADFKLKDIDVIIKPVSNYVIKGTEYNAEIFLAAYDPSLRPVMTVNGVTYRANNQGRIEYKQTPGTVGPAGFNGTIQFIGPDGPTSRAVRGEFMVAEPNVVVSPTKMNVVYRGIENPMSISLSGASLDDLEINVTNATKSRRGNEFVIRPGDGRTCDVSVSLNGKSMGSMSFRVKDIPKPMAAVHGISGKIVNKGELLASEGVVAEMKDFDFDLKYKITTFNVFVTIDGFVDEAVSNAERFTDKQKQLIGRVKSGQRVLFTEIKAMGPDGKQVDLSDFSLKLR
jgi:gliding motility-associated protein GldM